MAVSTLAMQLASLALMKATGGPFNNATLITASNNIAPSKGLAIGDIVESDYDGYAAMAGLAFGTPFVDGAGNAVMQAPGVEFQCTGLTLIETVFLWAVVNNGKTVVQMAEQIVPSVQMNAIGRGFVAIPRYQWGQ